MRSVKNSILGGVQIAIIVCCVAFVTGIWLGVIWEMARETPTEETVTVVEPISEGQQPGEIYTTEFWENGDAKITTTIEHVNQVSDHTIIITDRHMDDVISEIKAAQDEGAVR